MFYFVGAAVSKGEKTGDKSSESVDEEADGSGSEHNEPETKNTRGWSKLILRIILYLGTCRLGAKKLVKTRK